MNLLPNDRKVLVTGGNGFIGKAVVDELRMKGFSVVSAVRAAKLSDCEVKAPSLSGSADWSEVIGDCEIVVHTAGRAHILSDKVSNPLSEFRKVNVDGSVSLAKQAIAAGVKRFVFISSIGVCGPCVRNVAISENTQPNPQYDYAISKLEAEVELTKLFAEVRSELVIIRPSLVYSESAPGNFARLLWLASKNLPLPILGIKNKKSLVSLSNLVDFIIISMLHPAANGNVFVVADKERLSTVEILKNIAVGMNLKSRYFYFPEILLSGLFRIIGMSGIYEKVFGNLTVDISKAEKLLNWRPRQSMHQSLQESGRKYIKLKKY